jgi:gamma-glutamylcyclotransferase (GGCT)/AIG2-like uncharacterized protein YtfP
MTSGAGDAHIFVYGTLLSAFGAGDHPTLRGRARLIGPGTVPGLLFDAGVYPVALLDEAVPGRIRGELHAVPAASASELLELLDRYEGFLPDRPGDSLFVRQRVTVFREGGEPLGAWAYRYNRPVTGLTRIPGGDYLGHLRRAGRTSRG